jgi:hypothetical protein
MALAPLFWVIGIVNFMLDQPAGIIGGISALIVGTCSAGATCLFIASGGWRTEKRQHRQAQEHR